jgi:hypothetical protein
MSTTAGGSQQVVHLADRFKVLPSAMTDAIQGMTIHTGPAAQLTCCGPCCSSTSPLNTLHCPAKNACHVALGFPQSLLLQPTHCAVLKSLASMAHRLRQPTDTERHGACCGCSIAVPPALKVLPTQHNGQERDHWHACHMDGSIEGWMDHN